jgi:hypothetical protein
LPHDPQLRYYYKWGFRRIVCVRPGYFPHEESLDHGAILRSTFPLSIMAPLWECLPFSLVRRVLGWI